MKKIISTIFASLLISVCAFSMNPQQGQLPFPLIADDQGVDLPPETKLLMLEVSENVKNANSAETAARNGLIGLAMLNLSGIWDGIKSAAGYLADSRAGRLLTAPFDYTIGAAAQKTGLVDSVANNDFVKQNSYYLASAGNCAYTAARYALGLATIYAAYRAYDYATTPASQKKNDNPQDDLRHVDVRSSATSGMGVADAHVAQGFDRFAKTYKKNMPATVKQQTLAQQSPRISAEPKAVPAQKKRVRFKEPIAVPQAQQNNQSMNIEQAKDVVEAIGRDLRGSTKNLLAKYGQALSGNTWLISYGYDVAHKSTMCVAIQDSYCKQLILCLKGIDNGTMKRNEVLEKCVKPILNNITHIIKSHLRK